MLFRSGKENLELLEYCRYMCAIHRMVPALRRGTVKKLLAGRQFIAYGRMYGKYKAVVAVNNGEQEREEEIPIWQLGVEDDEFLWRIMATTEKGYNVGGANAEHSKGYLRLKMEPVSSILVITHADEFFSVAGGPKKKEQPKTPANRPAKRKKGRKKAVKGRKASRKPLDFSKYM